MPPKRRSQGRKEGEEKPPQKKLKFSTPNKGDPPRSTGHVSPTRAQDTTNGTRPGRHIPFKYKVVLKVGGKERNVVMNPPRNPAKNTDPEVWRKLFQDWLDIKLPDWTVTVTTQRAKKKQRLRFSVKCPPEHEKLLKDAGRSCIEKNYPVTTYKKLMALYAEIWEVLSDAPPPPNVEIEPPTRIANKIPCKVFSYLAESLQDFNDFLQGEGDGSLSSTNCNVHDLNVQVQNALQRLVDGKTSSEIGDVQDLQEAKLSRAEASTTQQESKVVIIGPVTQVRREC
eukprot:g3569.t1